jgi:ligand-binding sensor domain-containing protein
MRQKRLNLLVLLLICILQVELSLAKEKEYYSEFQDANYITDIVVEKEIIWFSTNNGLKFYDKQSKKWGIISIYDGLPASVINDIDVDVEYLWLATAEGLVRLDKKTRKIKVFTQKEKLKDNQILTIATERDKIWVAYGKGEYSITGGYYSAKNILTCFHWKQKKAQHYELSQSIYKLLAEENKVWIVQENMISCLDKETKEITSYTSKNVPILEGINFNQTAAILSDKNSIWVAGGDIYKGALLHFDKSTQIWSIRNHSFTFPIAKAGNILWVGSSYDVLDTSDFVVKYIKDYSTDWQHELFYKYGFMTAMACDGDIIWIGTTCSILMYHLKKNKVTIFFTEPRFYSYSYTRLPFQTLNSGKNRLYLASADELAIYEIKTLEFNWLLRKHIPSYSAYLIANQIEIGKYGDIWLSITDEYYGDVEGIELIHITDEKMKYKSTKIKLPGPLQWSLEDRTYSPGRGYILADDGEYLWVGLGMGEKRGLFKYDYIHEEWEEIGTTETGLQSDYIFDLKFDGSNLWVATEKGLFCYYKKEDRWEKIKKDKVYQVTVNKKIIAINQEKGVSLYNKNTKKWYNLPFKNVIQLLSLSNNNILVLEYEKIFLYDVERNTWQEFSNPGIYFVCEVKNQGLWGLSEEKLFKVNIEKNHLQVRPALLRIVFKEKSIKFAEGEKYKRIFGEIWEEDLR